MNKNVLKAKMSIEDVQGCVGEVLTVLDLALSSGDATGLGDVACMVRRDLQNNVSSKLQIIYNLLDEQEDDFE